MRSMARMPSGVLRQRPSEMLFLIAKPAPRITPSVGIRTTSTSAQLCFQPPPANRLRSLVWSEMINVRHFLQTTTGCPIALPLTAIILQVVVRLHKDTPSMLRVASRLFSSHRFRHSLDWMALMLSTCNLLDSLL